MRPENNGGVRLSYGCAERCQNSECARWAHSNHLCLTSLRTKPIASFSLWMRQDKVLKTWLCPLTFPPLLTRNLRKWHKGGEVPSHPGRDMWWRSSLGSWETEKDSRSSLAFSLPSWFQPKPPAMGWCWNPSRVGVPYKSILSRGILVDTPKGARDLSPRPFLIGSGWPSCSLVQNCFSMSPNSLRSGM